jgi:hypothetical protein
MGCGQGEERVELVKELHRVKTEIFMEMVESKQLPLRPGVKRLVMEAYMAGGTSANLHLKLKRFFFLFKGYSIELSSVRIINDQI